MHSLLDDLITMLDNVLEHFIEDIVDTINLVGIVQILKGLKNMLKKKKKDYLKLLIQRIEKGRWVLERWAFMLYSKAKVYLSMGYDLLVSIMCSSPISKSELWSTQKTCR